MYRIVHRYPVYLDGCFPYHVYFVQVKAFCFFGTRWKNIKRFTDRNKAIELLKILKG